MSWCFLQTLRRLWTPICGFRVVTCSVRSTSYPCDGDRVLCGLGVYRHRPSLSSVQVLRGITRESVQASLIGPMSSSWKIRPDMTRCLFRALASPFPTHVVSINWSRDVIASILTEARLANQG